MPPYEHLGRRSAHVERRIGEHVAELVPDGATLQMGIGAIPAAVGAALRDKRDLGVHTEMFTDVVVDLVEAGAITGARKEINRGKIVTAFLMGTPAAVPVRRRQPDGRDAPRRLHQRHVRDPALPPDGRRSTPRYRDRPDRPGVRRLDRPRASTAASAARWTSCAARRWPRRAARSSPCRRRRPAAPSRASCRCWRRAPAWSPRRAHVRTVVTEYGVAELYGRSLRERATALIAIAHPDFREELTAAARRTLFL